MKLHLVRRYFGALRPGPPSASDDEWAARVLTPAELPLYRRLPNHDRRHAIRVARYVETEIGAECESRWLAAALLHDVGKYDAHLSVTRRALATVAAAGRSGTARMTRWRTRPGWRGRFATYSEHGELGAAEIRAAGGREEAARWSAAHHHPETWAALPIPAAVVRALDRADHA
jgi:hypothetical protein